MQLPPMLKIWSLVVFSFQFVNLFSLFSLPSGHTSSIAPSDFQPFSEDRQSDSTDIYQSNGRTVREKSGIQFAIYFQSGFEAAGCEDKVLQCRGKSAALRNQRRRKIKKCHTYGLCALVFLTMSFCKQKNCIASHASSYFSIYTMLHIMFHFILRDIFQTLMRQLVSVSPRGKHLYPHKRLFNRETCCFRAGDQVFSSQRQQAFFFPFSLIFIPVAFYLSRMQIFIVIVFLACNFICLLCLVFYFLHQSDLSSVVIVSSVLIAELQLLLILVLVQQTFCLFRGQQKGAKQKNGKS